MKITEKEREELSQRLKLLEDMGGKTFIAKEIKISVNSIYNLLNPQKEVKPITYHKIKKGLMKVERTKERLINKK
ncbi:hypothetical protein [Spirosoma fluviale]|uniref:Uncharacterized protein n=1 Tax=Spirosoma fluviale TaxID=1597977 RepID=A0A286FD29_9BACT|nr:hypothetical protein [Spirosoma fluviale]SOD81112.1 hypothetical protein SAMN06269250_1678 [Spirosoma fluviale]